MMKLNHSVRQVGAALAVAVVAFAGGCSVAEQTDTAMNVACRAEGAKTQMPAGLCSLFAARLAQAGHTVTLSDDAPASATLVVTQAAKGRFMARIDQGGAMGPARGMARKGAPLDDAALAGFLDGLIAATPGLGG